MTSVIRLADVAERAGVSRVAAGRVLLKSGANHVRVGAEAENRIRAAARELGYHPNRSAQRLGGKTGNLIGVVVDTNPAEIELCRLVALERLAWGRGYQLLISAMPPVDDLRDKAASASILMNQGAAGIIFLTGGLNIAASSARAAFPSKAVYFGVQPVIGDAPGVVLDLAHGYRQAIRRFAETGRKRIAILNVEFNFGKYINLYSKYRLDAVMEEAAGFNGVEILPCAVTVDPGHRTPSFAQADAVAEKVVSSGVDAILAYSDLAAARMIQVLQARGLRIPEDVAVCGLNNLDIADLTSPPLTTIDEHPEAVAEAMLDLMLAQLDGGADLSNGQRVIRPELIIRKSA